MGERLITCSTRRGSVLRTILATLLVCGLMAAGFLSAAIVRQVAGVSL